ncbi:MAG: protein phosphatase CheZ [Burkholderiales bacterium]|nr:protein phosphatase CheZ [Burkholderiales bacterium]
MTASAMENRRSADVEIIEAGAKEQEKLSVHDVFVRIGMLTRNLHDTLRQLGYDKGVEAAVGSLPDARARLDYIANLTGKAAERVLDASERAKAVQDSIRTESLAMEAKWAALLGSYPDPRAMWELGRETQSHFIRTQARLVQVDGNLTEIMLAQDFHDLTGQVIQRVTRLAQSLEDQLVKLLLDASPPAQRKEVLEATLAGPVINGQGRDDVVTDQRQVDDLLESLGF